MTPGDVHDFFADPDEDGASDGLPGEIARLEMRIERLAETIEGCRKIMVVARVAIVGGGLLTVALLIGAVRPDLLTLSGATAALLGGIVALGSNASTARQAAAKMKHAEARRRELIDRLELREV